MCLDASAIDAAGALVKESNRSACTGLLRMLLPSRDGNLLLVCCAIFRLALEPRTLWEYSRLSAAPEAGVLLEGRSPASICASQC